MAVRTGRASVAIYDELLDRLVSGILRHGERISIEGLRTEFGVSKQPIMEALRLLSADGLIEIVPQVGSVVSTYPPQEIADFFDMFAGFEGAIAAAAAVRRSDEQLSSLERVSQRIEQLTHSDNAHRRAAEYRRLNRDFHRTIHDMANSSIMAETSRRMWDLSDFLVNSTGASEPFGDNTASRHQEHEEIRAALHARDPIRARAAMEHHIRDTATIIAL
ncbi:MAG: GntR family transcriptional regulator [Microbacterium sp.]|nr:GntR family transcriptional regulator [Microbacterium sp.]